MGVTSGSMQKDLNEGFTKFNGEFSDFLNSKEINEICKDHNKIGCVLWALNIQEFAETLEKEIPKELQLVFDDLFKENEEGFLNNPLKV